MNLTTTDHRAAGDPRVPFPSEVLSVGPHTVSLATRPGGFAPSASSFLLAASLPDVTGLTVADLGCGTGLQGLIAARQGARHVHACDVEPENLELTRANFAANNLADAVSTHGLDVISGLDSLPVVDVAIFNLPFVPGGSHPSADASERGAISAGDGLAHTAAALNALRARLRPEGRVFFTFSSIGNVAGLERLLNATYRWEVIRRLWVPWRHFERTRQAVVDALVRESHAYYRVDHGVPMTELRVVEACPLRRLPTMLGAEAAAAAIS